MYLDVLKYDLNRFSNKSGVLSCSVFSKKFVSSRTISNTSSDWYEATVTTDGGGELYKSDKFKKTCNQHGYEVHTTAADASFQNGIVERPHRTLKERMRCMLYASRLGSEFWTDALLHAVWLYNRTYHSAIKTTPY